MIWKQQRNKYILYINKNNIGIMDSCPSVLKRLPNLLQSGSWTVHSGNLLLMVWSVYSDIFIINKIIQLCIYSAFYSTDGGGWLNWTSLYDVGIMLKKGEFNLIRTLKSCTNMSMYSIIMPSQYKFSVGQVDLNVGESLGDQNLAQLSINIYILMYLTDTLPQSDLRKVLPVFC